MLMEDYLQAYQIGNWFFPPLYSGSLFLSAETPSLNEEMNSRQFSVKFLNPGLLPISRGRAEMGSHEKNPQPLNG